MEKQDIINYILNTPENTNPAILGGMLEQLIAESGSGGEGGLQKATVNLAYIDTADNQAVNLNATMPVSYVIPLTEDGYLTLQSQYEIASNDSSLIFPVIPEVGGALVFTNAEFWDDEDTEYAINTSAEQYITVSGDGEYVQQLNGVIITGNATITVKVTDNK